jgi:hypothetical protein
MSFTIYNPAPSNERSLSNQPYCTLPPRKSVKHIVRLVFTTALTVPGIFAQSSWTANYRNDLGWDKPQYGTTIMLGDVNGDGREDVCGRGLAGIYCSLSRGNSFGVLVQATTDYSDLHGWNNIVYYGSIRLADVNGDNRADICGRGVGGIYCGTSNGAGFAPLQLWTTHYKDADGWNKPQYATTIMFGDINNDGRDDVCGRGVGGVYCSVSTGFAFLPMFLASNAFSDGNGWGQLIYYGSLRLGDVNGDRRADICGRGLGGVYCATSNSAGFTPMQLWTAQYKDADGWNDPQYATTIMLAEVNGDRRAYVCGRGSDGIWCSLSTGAAFGPAELANTFYANANGWSQLIYYGSIRLGHVNGDGRADVCGRGVSGIWCAVSAVSFR